MSEVHTTGDHVQADTVSSGWEVVSSPIPQTKQSVRAQMDAQIAIQEFLESDEPLNHASLEANAWKVLDRFARTQSSRIVDLQEFRYQSTHAESVDEFLETLQKSQKIEVDSQGNLVSLTLEGQSVPITTTSPVSAEDFVQFRQFPHLIVAEYQPEQELFDASFIIRLNPDTVSFVENWSRDRQEWYLRSHPEVGNVMITFDAEAELEPIQSTESESAVGVSVSEYQPTDLDVLDPGETLWGEVAEELGAGEDDAAVSEVVTSYLETDVGKQTVWELASQTQEGKASIESFKLESPKNMTSEQATHLAQFLAPGELSGLVDFIESLSAPQTPEYTDPEVLLDALEGARDTIMIERGSKPLEAVEAHIAQLFAPYTYNANLAKQALDYYILNTKAGREWLFSAIMDRSNQSPITERARQVLASKNISTAKDIPRLLVDAKGRPSTQVFWMELSRAVGASSMVQFNQSIAASIKSNL